MTTFSAIYSDLQRANAQVFFYNIGFAEALTLTLDDFPGMYGVFIDGRSVRSKADLKCKLAHECGHCATGALHTTTSPWQLAAKHEHKAWRWSIERYLPFDELRTAMARGLTEPWQLAEWFDFPEDYIRRALHHYTQTLGLSFQPEDGYDDFGA